MGIDTYLRDPDTKRGQSVDPQGAAHTIGRGIPPFGVPNFQVWFRQYLTDDGLSTGSNDMKVDGTTPQDFWIPASQTADRYITALSIEIVDDGATIDLFGALAPLTNGCRLFYRDEIGDERDIHDGLTTNFDVYRLCGGIPSFGDGATVFQIPNLGTPPAKYSGYVPYLDLAARMPPWGIRLPYKGSQKLIWQVRDDLTGFDASGILNVIAYGFDRLPDDYYD